MPSRDDHYYRQTSNFVWYVKYGILGTQIVCPQKGIIFMTESDRYFENVTYCPQHLIKIRQLQEPALVNPQSRLMSL